MQRRLVMTLAMSIDGFIADEEGGYAWIKGDGNHQLDTPNKWDFDAFLNQVDTVIMGNTCYQERMHLDYQNKTVFIASSSPHEDHDNLRFISGDICSIVREELKKPGKDIFLFGGGKLVDQFIKADMIDEYIIGIIPVILGRGRPLFYHNSPVLTFTLTEYMVDEGIVILRYRRR